MAPALARKCVFYSTHISYTMQGVSTCVVGQQPRQVSSKVWPATTTRPNNQPMDKPHSPKGVWGREGTPHARTQSTQRAHTRTKHVRTMCHERLRSRTNISSAKGVRHRIHVHHVYRNQWYCYHSRAMLVPTLCDIQRTCQMGSLGPTFRFDLGTSRVVFVRQARTLHLCRSWSTMQTNDGPHEPSSGVECQYLPPPAHRNVQKTFGGAVVGLYNLAKEERQSP